MKNRNSLLMISLLLALATAGAAFFWLKTQDGSNAKPVEKVALWTAKEDIAGGAVITDKMLEKTMVSKDQIPEGVVTDSKDIVGHYAKDSILKGESFPPQRLYSETDRLLSMRLEPGYRAFSISMTQFSGVADLIKPGDRVDVFVFLKEIEKDSVIVRSDIAQVLLQNVEVLAVRKETQKDSPPPEAVSDLYAVTVAVPVKAVEKLILGEETGLLKIALRPLNEKNTYTSYGVIWKELLLDPSLKIRDFEPSYGTEKNLDALTTAQPNQTVPDVTAPSVTPAQAGTPSAVTPVPSQESSKPVKKATYTIYTVQPGDTLMSISRKYFGGSAAYYDDIMRMNGLSDQTIKPGQKLKIPLSGR